jgi:outer membrane biosynthesis protein TonB
VPQSSLPPPPPPRGNLKFVLIGLLFLGGAVGLWFLATQNKPAEPAPPPKPPEVARVNPMAQPDLVLEEPTTPDAGTPAAPEPVAKHRTPQAKVGEWECSGDLPGAAQVLQENRAQVRSCYERRLKMNNVLQGDLRLKLKVGANGRVVATALSGSMHDNDVVTCVRNLAQGWTFPSPSGGNCAVLQVPFQFSPKE